MPAVSTLTLKMEHNGSFSLGLSYPGWQLAWCMPSKDQSSLVRSLILCIYRWAPCHPAYPEPDRRGRMLGLWVLMRSAAPVIGGAIIFGLNAKLDSAGSVSLHTYVVIIGIMCAGPFISLLISNPDQVQRRDGVKIYLRKQGWGQTIRRFFKVLSSQNVRSFCKSFQ